MNLETAEIKLNHLIAIVCVVLIIVSFVVFLYVNVRLGEIEVRWQVWSESQKTLPGDIAGTKAIVTMLSNRVDRVESSQVVREDARALEDRLMKRIERLEQKKGPP